MKNKSLYVFLTISCLLLFLAGCGKNENKNNENNSETNSISVNRLSADVTIREYFK